MKYPLKYLCLLFATGFFNYCAAQTQDTVNQWNIQACFDYARAHNIQISTLRLNQEAAVQDVIAAKGVRIPSFSATIGNTFYNANNNVSGSTNYINQFSSSGNYSLNSSITLWQGNYINNNIRQSTLYNQSAELAIQQSQNSIILAITQAYLGILLSKENEKYIREIVSTSEARLKQGQLFYDAGSAAKKDVLQLQAQLASDNYLLVQVQNAIRQNILSLKQILQLPTDTLFDIVTPVFLDSSAVVPPLRSVQELALNNFPEIKIGYLGVDIANLTIAKAKAGFLPTLTANAGFGTGYSSIFGNNSYAETGYFQQTGNNFSTHIGVNLSIPIFSNFINKTNLEKANIGYKQANLSLKNAELILSQTVEQAYLNVQNAQQAYQAANQQLLAATENYRVVNEQFKIGGLNTYDLLLQRNQYVQAVQAFTQAKYTVVLQQKIYQFYTGKVITL